MPESTAPKSYRRQTRIGDQRDLKSRILASARSLFFANGYFTTTTKRIAVEAGTSESGVFRMFADKYEVLMAVYNDCWREINDEIEATLPPGYKDPRRRILDVLSVVWTLYERKPLLMSFIIINTGNTDTLLVSHQEKAIISDENVKYVSRIEGLATECVSRRLVPRILTVRALSEALLGITEGILLGWYLADKTTTGRYPAKVSVKEALAVVSTLLYGDKSPKIKMFNGR